MAKISNQDLRVYSVWVPILPTDGKISIPQATRRFNDARVSHFWDSEGKLVKEYAPILQIDGQAWDIFLLYDRDAEWKQEAPPPTFWMDQIGADKGTPFDGAQLAEKVRGLLQQPASNTASPAAQPTGNEKR